MPLFIFPTKTTKYHKDFPVVMQKVCYYKKKRQEELFKVSVLPAAHRKDKCSVQ
jgi:hypothetical protein